MQCRLLKDFKMMIIIPFFSSRESQSGWGWEGPLEAVQFKPVLKAGLTRAGCSGLHHASDSLLDLMQFPHAFLGPRSPAGPKAPSLCHQGWAEGRKKTSWPQPALQLVASSATRARFWPTVSPAARSVPQSCFPAGRPHIHQLPGRVP